MLQRSNHTLGCTGPLAVEHLVNVIMVQVAALVWILRDLYWCECRTFILLVEPERAQQSSIVLPAYGKAGNRNETDTGNRKEIATS